MHQPVHPHSQYAVRKSEWEGDAHSGGNADPTPAEQAHANQGQPGPAHRRTAPDPAAMPERSVFERPDRPVGRYPSEAAYYYARTGEPSPYTQPNRPHAAEQTGGYPAHAQPPGAEYGVHDPYGFPGASRPGPSYHQSPPPAAYPAPQAPPPPPQAHPAPGYAAEQGNGDRAHHHPHAGEQGGAYPDHAQHAAPPAPSYPQHYAPPPVSAPPAGAYHQQMAVPYPGPYLPGYFVHPGQPVIYPGHLPGQPAQYAPYGQPVPHIIVLPGQMPQVITADPAAPALAEADTATEEEKAAEASSEDAADPADTDGEPAPAAEEEVLAEAAPREEAGPAAAEAGSDRPGESSLVTEALAGLAMRDLSLVDALLEMVEQLEGETQDPDLLDKLFQIDNFATRMRRNGENLLVLAGHQGGESDAYDEIVPLLDVARAATSEIKDYSRVRIGRLPQRSITGIAADDISHLLAELLDNATGNSPEHSQVVVSAQEMSDGRLMVAVEDEGIGIPGEQLAELNKRLSGAPVIDDEVPRHMGLYVASRIAAKHGLDVRLESRAYRGVSAYAIIPTGLLRVATPPTPSAARTGVPSMVSMTPSTPNPGTTGTNGVNSANKPATEQGSGPALTAAGLPRRSATPHGSPLRMMPRPEPNPEPTDDASKMSAQDRAEMIRDELGDFLDGERAALERRDNGEADS